jgi:hypothetical protein
LSTLALWSYLLKTGADWHGKQAFVNEAKYFNLYWERAMETIIVIYFFAGMGIVLAFAVNYFNQPGYKFADDSKSTTGNQEDFMLEPVLPKYLTGRFEYNFYLFAFVLVTELIYVLLVLFLPDLLPDESTKIADPLRPTTQNIVLATLIITGVAPNLPYVRQLLNRSKLYLHEKAQIPRKGRDVYFRIKRYQPHYTPADIKSILNDERYLGRDQSGQKVRMDLLESDFKIDEWSIEGRWAKLSYLLFHIDRWSNRVPFRSYIGNRELQRSSIECAYDELQKQMVMHRNGQLSESETNHLNLRVDATLHRTYRLISCLLYLAAKSDAAVDTYLDQLGYAISERNDFPIPWRRLVFVLFAISGSIVVGGILALVVTQVGIFNLAVEIRTKNIFKWVGFAVPFLSIPVLVVLLIKRQVSMNSEAWPVVTETSHYARLSDRPWHIYLIVALVAYIVGGLVLFGTSVFVKIIDSPITDYSAMLRNSFVWSGIVLVTAGFTAFRLDSAPDLNRSPQVHLAMQSVGAMFQGAATLAATFIAFVHTINKGDFNPLSLPEVERGKFYVYCTIAFILGASLYFASGFGRLRQRRRAGRRLLQRSVTIHSGKRAFAGNTVNVSREGMLIKSDGFYPSEQNTVQISDPSGSLVEGRIVKLRRNSIHVEITDQSAWSQVQKGLGIQAPT